MNAPHRRFRGALVALVTPFTESAVDGEALDRLVDFQLREGTDGLVLCGTTAESPTLSDDEQRQIIARVIERVHGRCPVIVGSGTNCTAKTLKLSIQAQELGADGLMIVAPYYNKPTQEGLRQHFGHVAQRVDLPIILYNIPGRCGVEIQHETLCKLYEEFENIVAVKHATGSVEQARRLRASSDIDILSGDDPLTLPLLEVGAVGVISVLANIVPRQVRAITGAFAAGDPEQARRLHHELESLGDALLKLSTNPIPIKTALAMCGMVREEFRLPMCPMEEEPRCRLRALLAEHGLLPQTPAVAVSRAAGLPAASAGTRA